MLADRFAAELLMPTRLFLQKYLNIMNYSKQDIDYTITYLSTYFEVKKDSVKKIREVIEVNRR
ncbi:MAG: ImmA/IrrE family metallo-endopeptidase [Anaerobutyricum soehngenii]